MSPVRDLVREGGRVHRKARAVGVVAVVMFVTVPTTSGALSPPPAPAPALGATPVVGPAPKKAHKKRKKEEPNTIPDMIRLEFGKHATEALRIADCESRFDTDDVSSAGAIGVFQIRLVDHGWRIKKVHGKDLTDPRTNIDVAHHIFKDQGWRPWVCARILGIAGGGSGTHRRHHRAVGSRADTRNHVGEHERRAMRAPRRPRGNMSW